MARIDINLSSMATALAVPTRALVSPGTLVFLGLAR